MDIPSTLYFPFSFLSQTQFQSTFLCFTVIPTFCSSTFFFHIPLRPYPPLNGYAFCFIFSFTFLSQTQIQSTFPCFIVIPTLCFSNLFPYSSSSSSSLQCIYFQLYVFPFTLLATLTFLFIHILFVYLLSCSSTL